MSNTLVAGNSTQQLPVSSGSTLHTAATPSAPSPESIVEKTVELFDRTIGFQRYGHGPINWLFICGGVGCYRKDYPENVLRAFDSSQYTIVCIDPPGYGESRPPDRQQEVNLNKKDAQFGLALMQKLQLTPFACLGWSEGGRTTIHLAHLATPKLCTHLVLLSTSTKVDFRGDMAFKGMRNTDQWLPNAKATYLEHYSEEYLKTQWAALCDVVSQVYSDLGGRFPSDMVLAQVKQPVLIVNGGNDRFIMDPKHMTEKLANSRVEVHAQGGHDLHIKYPRWFAVKLAQFVKETPAQGVTKKL